jgi:peptidoglycan/LPS O-acetylase OafA/YrhL
MVRNMDREYIKGIDGLRAIAVLAVILFHMDSFPFWQGGFTGVDIFFVISGYVISKSLANTSDITLGSTLLGFYKRRLTRIIPALLVMLLVTTLASTLFIPSAWLGRTIDSTGLSAFFGYSNFSLAWNNENYYSPRVDYNPFLHTWSLGLEEQFYLIFPFIFYFQLKHKGKADNKKTKRKCLPSFVLIALAVSSFLFSIFESTAHGRNAYYLLPSRFWELATGVLLFLLHQQGRLVPKSKGWSNLLIVTGLGIVGAGFLMADAHAFPFPWALLPVTGTVLLICGALEREDTPPGLQRVLCCSVLTYIGRISYSLYLWHWPVCALFRWTFGFETMISKGLYVLVTFLMAMISYHFIEHPIRRNGFLKRQKSWRIVTVSLVVIVTTYFSARFIVASKSEWSLSVTKNTTIWNSRRYWFDGPKKPVPVLFAPPYRCSDWFNRMNPIGANGLTVSREFLKRMRQPVMESMTEMAGMHEHFYIWDPFPVLCTGETFSAYDQQGQPIFRDGDHLSGHGNRMLAPSFRKFLVSLWGQ